MLLKSSPKKRIHDHDIPLSLRMSGHFCTSRISINTQLARTPFFRKLRPWSDKTVWFRHTNLSSFRSDVLK